MLGQSLVVVDVTHLHPSSLTMWAWRLGNVEGRCPFSASLASMLLAYRKKLLFWSPHGLTTTMWNFPLLSTNFEVAYASIVASIVVGLVSGSLAMATRACAA